MNNSAKKKAKPRAYKPVTRGGKVPKLTGSGRTGFTRGTTGKR